MIRTDLLKNESTKYSYIRGMSYRKIIHIDMDAFYASVEQLDFPELRGKAVAVGWQSDRGVLTTASYEARKFGVKSAMPVRTAMRLCPHLIVVPPRFDRYHEISSQVRTIFKRYTDLIEPLSLDEAYLDVTENKRQIELAMDVAKCIKKDIKDEVHLIASAGVSYNKFLAKMASDEDKPDGLYVIHPLQAQEYIDKLPIRRFYGVGKVTAEKFKQMGVLQGSDLKRLSLEILLSYFGKIGQYFYDIARGIDNRIVEPNQESKSIAVENTFQTDVEAKEDFERELFLIVDEIWLRYEDLGKIAKTVQLKLKFNDFKVITRSVSDAKGFYKKTKLLKAIAYLMREVVSLEKPVRLIGVQLANFLNEEEMNFIQLEFDFDKQKTTKHSSK
ncbi:MAG: DNA polymerase IV [Chitinophagales bacterium]|nr:DNA polymerase IV [Chitinophagales bacterium]